MEIVARVITVSTAVALLSAPAFAQKVTYDTSRAADFSQVRTFSIRQTPPADPYASKTTAYDSPIVRQNTNAAVASQLEARGLRRDDVHPDVYVTTHRTFQTEYYGYGWPGWGPGWGYGYGGYYGYGWGSYYLEPIIVGTLVVDINDAHTGELMWRGLSERDMHPTSSPEHRLKRINKEVYKIFKKYPAGIVATSGREVPSTTDH
jgi:uncharacterized protein DUF4136